MTITRYVRRSPLTSPWFEVEDMTNRLNRFFGDTNREGSAWSPSMNVEETSDELLLTAEVPGLAIEDIEIQVENNILTVAGEKKEDREEGEDRRYHVWERKHGSFKRTLTLPRTVKTEEITAHAKDGILFVRMPKAPEAKSRKIDVKSEG